MQLMVLQSRRLLMAQLYLPHPLAPTYRRRLDLDLIPAELDPLF